LLNAFAGFPNGTCCCVEKWLLPALPVCLLLMLDDGHIKLIFKGCFWAVHATFGKIPTQPIKMKFCVQLRNNYQITLSYTIICKKYNNKIVKNFLKNSINSMHIAQFTVCMVITPQV